VKDNRDGDKAEIKQLPPAPALLQYEHDELGRPSGQAGAHPIAKLALYETGRGMGQIKRGGAGMSSGIAMKRECCH